MDGGTDADIMVGLFGNDTYIVDNPKDIVREKPGLAYGKDTVRSSVSYTLADNVETLSLTGTHSINGNGNALANTITGNAKNNVLDGKTGIDILRGGPSKDTFVFDTAIRANNVDHIKDFKSIDDTIRLENSGSGLFTKLHNGTLHADEFALVGSKSAVVDSDAHILYDKAHGALYYDPNGGTAAGRVEFAVLDNHTTLKYADFFVV